MMCLKPAALEANMTQIQTILRLRWMLKLCTFATGAPCAQDKGQELVLTELVSLMPAEMIILL